MVNDTNTVTGGERRGQVGSNSEVGILRVKVVGSDCDPGQTTINRY